MTKDEALKLALASLYDMVTNGDKADRIQAIKSIFEIHEVLAQPVQPKRTWVGIDWSEIPDEEFHNRHFGNGASWAELALKEKNT